MKIFVTGATGYIGEAVAEAFSRSGHWVTGLVRSKDKTKALEAEEVQPIIGDMRAPAAYLHAAEQADVLIHCAAEWSAEFEALDRLTVKTFIELAKGSARQRTLIYTSGVWLYGNTGRNLVNETSAFESAHLFPWRAEHEKQILAAAASGVRTLVIRPGCVYGRRGGLTGAWFDSARKGGAAQVVGDGKNRWAVVHVDDLADLYVRAAESGLSGELFNATDRSRFTVLEMAEAASRAAGSDGKVKHIALDDAKKTLGDVAQGFVLDQHVDSSKAVYRLGWNPRYGGFPEMAERYFAAWKAAQS